MTQPTIDLTVAETHAYLLLGTYQHALVALRTQLDAASLATATDALAELFIAASALDASSAQRAALLATAERETSVLQELRPLVGRARRVASC